MFNLFHQNRSLSLSTTIVVLVIFATVSISYNFFLAKQAEGGLFGGGGGIFSGIFKGVKDAILSVVDEVIEMITDFVIENKEMLMAAAIAWKWYTQPAKASDQIFATIKSLALHTMLTLITMDIITEIQGGEPKYINDWSRFLKEAAETAGALFVTEYLGMGYLCSPWDADIKIALLDDYTFDTRIACTFEDMVGNIEDFFNDFSNGGWKGFIHLTKPENDFLGGILLATDEKEKREKEAQAAGQAEAIAGQGFMGQKCTQADIDAGKCATLGEIITPGSVISGMATNILSKPIDFLSDMTNDIASALPAELQTYAQAILGAYFNVILKDAMQDILGHSSSTDYNTAIQGAFEGIETEESVELEIASANTASDKLNDIKTIVDEITTTLVDINDKETDILNSSANNLFTSEPIMFLPSYESYTIDAAGPPQEITLTASGVGQAFFHRTKMFAPKPEEEDYAIVTIDSISVEISSDQDFYNSIISAAWSAARAQCDDYCAALQALQSNPLDTSLQAAAETEETEFITEVNNLLSHWSLSASTVTDSIIALGNAKTILDDILGKEKYDPGLLATDYTEPFLSSYYCKYFYDLTPKEEELNIIINPSE